MPKEFVTKQTVHYEDTDFTGSVYHANYLKFFERARSEFFGHEYLRRKYRETGIGFVVRSAGIIYKKPACFADVLEIRTVPAVEDRYIIRVVQTAHGPGKGELLVKAEVQLVCVHDNALVPPPDWALAKMREFEADGG